MSDLELRSDDMEDIWEQEERRRGKWRSYYSPLEELPYNVLGAEDVTVCNMASGESILCPPLVAYVYDEIVAAEYIYSNASMYEKSEVCAAVRTAMDGTNWFQMFYPEEYKVLLRKEL